MAKPARFQFSMSALLLVSTVVAVALGIAAALEVPFDHPAVYGLLAGYLIMLGVWAVIRGPTVLRELHDLRRRRQELAAKRAAMIAEVNRRKQTPSSRDPRP